MRSCIALLSVSTLLISAAAMAQQISSVTVIPADPTVSDEVFLFIEGERWSTDMVIQPFTVQQSGNSFIVNLDFVSEGFGLPMVTLFDTTISLGMLEAGDYTATVTGLSHGSPVNSVQVEWSVSAITGISGPDVGKLEMTAAPNPFVRDLHLLVTLPEASDVSIRIFDILGKEVAVIASGRYAAGKQTFGYSASALPDGRYYVQSVINGKTVTRQVMKRGN